MTRLFLCGLVGLVIASGIITNTRATKNDGIYFSHRRTSNVGQAVKTLQLSELQKHGNFGLARPDGKTGLIILDGIAYSINENGTALRMKDDTHMPAAAVKFFRTDRRVSMKRSLTLAGLQACLDSLMIKNEPAAIKVQGRFAWMKYRNFAPQGGVPGFHERQSFERQSIQGVMVGFYSAEKTGMQGADYHFHFIDRNKTTGGVVEDCALKDVYIEIDYAQSDSSRRILPLANMLK